MAPATVPAAAEVGLPDRNAAEKVPSVTPAVCVALFPEVLANQIKLIPTRSISVPATSRVAEKVPGKTGIGASESVGAMRWTFPFPPFTLRPVCIVGPSSTRALSSSLERGTFLLVFFFLL